MKRKWFDSSAELFLFENHHCFTVGRLTGRAPPAASRPGVSRRASTPPIA